MTSANPLTAQQPNPPANTQFPGTNTAAGSASNELNGSSFMTLLVAQLQAQDPLNPMDPSQMVTQLTQVNSLQELYQIDSDMQTLIGAVQSGTSTTPAQSSAQASPQGTSETPNSQNNSSSGDPLANTQ